MVKTGGKATMLGQWRIVLKQAEESARAGRFDEALALAGRPDVSDHRQAVQLRARLTGDLIDRAGRRAQADDLSGAIADLALAEVHGAPPDALAVARLKIAEQVTGEVRAGLETGDPCRALERIERFARHHISGPSLRRLREAAEIWRQALDELRRGEFGQAREALDRAERLAGDSAGPAIQAARRDLDAKRQAAQGPIDRLYQALDGGVWAEILGASEGVLAIVPEHPTAKQARSQAWQQIGALNPAGDLPRRAGAAAVNPNARTLAQSTTNNNTAGARGPETLVIPAEPPPPPKPKAGDRFLLWADGIGGYLVCLGDEIVLGRDSPDSQADVPLLGDLSRRHAILVRSGDGYLLRAIHPTFLNNRKVEAATLRNGDVIRLGSSVELEFHQPSPVSTTARLVLVSRHRLRLAVDGVILMAETCLVGPSNQAHVPAPNLDAPLVLYRQGTGLWCKAPGAFEVDGRHHTVRAPLTMRSSVLGNEFSFSLEPLGPRTTAV